MSNTPITEKNIWYESDGRGCVAAEVCEKLERENTELRAWKESALAVEREWDAQVTAKILGARLGESCRRAIAREVPKLVVENAALRTVLKRWLKVADDCHLEQQEVGYSEYNITAELMVDTRALLDAARKEAQP